MMTIILGGGISGLSAAYYLLNKFPKDRIHLFEATNRLGGWIRSSTLQDGTIFEQGPRTFRPSGLPGANTLRLLEDLELGERLIPIKRSQSAAKNRMIFANGKLHLLPTSFLSLLKRQEPFSKALISFLSNDLINKMEFKPDNDESIYNFVCRRFDKEVADYLISPMICGICGGNAKEISVRMLMPNLFDLEQKYGSISRGLLFSSWAKKNIYSAENSKLREKVTKEKWSIYTFKGGSEIFPQTLCTKIKEKGADIKLNYPISEIIFESNYVRLKSKDGTFDVTNYLISAIPAANLAPLLQNQHPKLSNLLSSIQSVSIATVNFKFNKSYIDKEGFGFLVAPKENIPLLGVIYDSCLKPNNGQTILTAMLGGYRFNKFFGANPSHDLIYDTAMSYVKEILNIKSAPDDYQINILNDCIPQYKVGHAETVKNIERYLTDNKLRLSICGNSYNGVGVNDAILSAKRAINNVR